VFALKRLARNKRAFSDVVMHLFTHLDGATASPGFAQSFLTEMSQRLAATDHSVEATPFHFCAWDLEVHGESLAKKWKEI
jgi:Archaea-specific editing domain of threonyl-tRNA synthetase